MSGPGSGDVMSREQLESMGYCEAAIKAILEMIEEVKR